MTADTAGRSRQTRPNPPTSNINLGPGDIQRNLVITRVGPGMESITICNFAGFIAFFDRRDRACRA